MARRIVVLGIKREAKAVTTCQAFEIHADDASALVDTGMCRVEVAKRGGELHDALTLGFTPDFLKKVRGDMGQKPSEPAVYRNAFERAHAICRVIRDFEVPTPIPFE